MTVDVLRARNLFGKALEAEHPACRLLAISADDDGTAKARELEEQGDYGTAYLYLIRALAAKEDECGPDFWDTALRLTTLADFLERRERVDEATELRRRALAVFERTDVGTLMTANTHQALARTAEAAGELDLAEQHWRGAMNSTPASHLAMAQFSLGEFLFRQERWAESLAEVTAAGEFWRTRPHNRTDVARSAAVRAVNLMHLERWAEAVHSLDEVVEIQGEHGPDHADVRWASELLSICRDNLAHA